MPKVYDASALLAILFSEPGADAAMEHLLEPGGLVSAVNWAEVAAKLVERGMKPADVRRELGNFSLAVVALDEDLALASAALRPATRPLGLSLGDRCCLALAQQQQATAVTADKAWTRLKGFDVAAVR